MQTRKIGQWIGQKLCPGDFLQLEGSLGTGKTELVRGLVLGVGIDPSIDVRSPSFTIVNEYPGNTPLYHMDLYRVHDPIELEGIGLEEYFYQDGICAVEWLSLCPNIAPLQRIKILLSFASEEERMIEIESIGNDLRLNALVKNAIEYFCVSS